MVVIGGSRYMLPFSYQYEGQTDETQPPDRWRWIAYNAQNWYDESAPKLRTPAAKKSFDSDCAGCHFTGFSMTGDDTMGYLARAVIDPQGEMDYDGDGKLEELNVSCESCHGPGSEHWACAGAGNAIVSPQLLTPEREVTMCAACHTRTLGVAAGGTEAPIDANGSMPRAGISRSEFLSRFVTKLDDGLWDETVGDGLHSKKHHQQASDFIKSTKYRNPTQLMTTRLDHVPRRNDMAMKGPDMMPIPYSNDCGTCHLAAP